MIEGANRKTMPKEAGATQEGSYENKVEEHWVKVIN